MTVYGIPRLLKPIAHYLQLKAFLSGLNGSCLALLIAMLKLVLGFILVFQFVFAGQTACFWFYQDKTDFLVAGWSNIYQIVTKNESETAAKKTAFKMIDDRIKANGDWLDTILRWSEYPAVIDLMNSGDLNRTYFFPGRIEWWIKGQITRAAQSTTISNELDVQVQRRKYSNWLKIDKWIAQKAFADRPKGKPSKQKLFDDVGLENLQEIHTKVITEICHRYQAPPPNPFLLFTPYGFLDNAMKRNEEAQFTKNSAGRLRTGRVFAVKKTQKTAQEYILNDEVAGAVNQAFRWLKQESVDLHPLERIFTFYRLMISIHPFADANGRSLRLFCDYLLMRNGYPPMTSVGNVAIFPNYNASDFPSTDLLFKKFLTDYYNDSLRF